MKIIKALLFLAVLCCNYSAYAQQDLTLYYMDNVPQRQYLNPAFRPNSSLTIGLPAISSMYFNYISTLFTPKNLFDANGNTTTLTIDNLKEKIRNNNYLGVNQKVDLLSFGFKVKKNYFSFNVTENVFSRVNFSRGFLELPLYGNADFDHHGGMLDMKNTGINLSQYTEFGLGWQREMNDKLNLGIKAKFLLGKANVWTKTNSYKIETNPNNFNWNISGELDVRTSGLDSNSALNKSDIQGYLLNTSNKGFAIDMGGAYQFNDKINLNASIIDLGFINWKSDNFNISTNDANFEFTGLDLTEILYSQDSVFSDSIDAAITRLRDAAENELGYRENNDAYTKMLMARIHLGGTYKLYEGKRSSGRAGVLIQTEIYNRTLRPSLTLSYNQSLGRWLNASVAYSMVNRGFNNLGVGISTNLGPVQLYVATDNIFAARLTAFKTNGDNVFAYPTNSKMIHVHAGLNLTFGRKRKDSDKDGVSDNLDECPDVFGLKEFRGCPDTDADGVKDSKDDCPTVAGLIEFNGCPDTDGDKTIDKEDNCPKIVGPKENKGCPWGDKDKDGVLDNVDKCPNMSGPKENEGCPHSDTDGDGVLDKDDACPDVVGVKENKGCPKLEKEEEEVLKRAFDNLEFESGKDIIKSSSYTSLNELAVLMTKKKEWNLKISGHTDNVGNDNSNMKLSEKRSLAVKNYLSQRGIDENRITALWFGDSQPIESNKTKEGRQKNRRVEMEIVF